MTHQESHHLNEWSAAGSPPQKIAVATCNERRTATHQPHCRIAQRRVVPEISLHPLCTKEHFGDLTIRCVAVSSIDGAEHLTDAFASLWGQSSVGHVTTVDGMPETIGCVEPFVGIRIEGNERDRRLGSGRLIDDERMYAKRPGSKRDVIAVGR